MSTTVPAARGNTRKNMVAYAVIGVFVGVCAIGWAIIMAHTEGTPGVTPQVVSWQTTDTSVRVHYEIAQPKGDEVHCAIVAYAPSHAEVGRVEVAVPAGTPNIDTRREVPTSSLATAVDVRECRTG
jgi:hypothetical protein